MNSRSDYAIEANQLTKNYKNFTLDIPKFRLPKGFISGLIGENGAGKSTLMKCMFGIYKMDEGEIYYEGEMVNIDVLDFGGGISQEVNESLFCEFKTSKKYDGSGIGLYFSKKLANDKLGGDLKLISHKNPTQFRLSFPRYQNHKA